MNTLCLSSRLSLALILKPSWEGNLFYSLHCSQTGLLKQALQKRTMSFILEAGLLPMMQYSSSICRSLSSSLKSSLQEAWHVKIEPKYSAMISPLAKLAFAKRPSPQKGSLVCFISSLSMSESRKSQKGASTSSGSCMIIMSLSLRSGQSGCNIYMQNQAGEAEKLQVQSQFAEIFKDPFNTVCFQCGRKTNQWVETELAIFLCLTCAGLYKAASDQITIKCIPLDPFSPEELRFISLGGNTKLKEFLNNYQMQELIYRQKLQTKAIAYYRTLLREEFHGRMAPMAPQLEDGREFAHSVKKLSDMSPGQVIDQLASKARRVGQSAVEFGGRAFSSIQEKWRSGQMKEGAVHLKESLSSKVKGFWQSLTKKGEQSKQQAQNSKQ